MRFCWLIVFLAACTSKNEEQEGRILATVYDKSLTIDQVSPLIPDDASPEDSVVFVNNFVEAWIRDMVVVHQAEQTLPKEALDVNARLEQYRRSLLVYAYEQEYAKQKLDTVVTEEEIKAHYEANQDDFRLVDYIVKVHFVKLLRDQEGKSNVAKWFKSDKEKDKIELEKYCSRNAVNYYNDTEAWIYFSDLLREIPIKTEDRESFLKNTNTLQFEDEEFAYFLKIYEYRLKDAVSPLSFERENIRARILNSRTTEIVREMRTSLLNNSQSQIKNYVKN